MRMEDQKLPVDGPTAGFAFSIPVVFPILFGVYLNPPLDPHS
jgi:hypothetical protein